jgi:hypothetical protein
MKPQVTRRVEVIEVEYWDCGCSKHRHLTREVALRCAEKLARATKSGAAWTDNATLAVLAEHRGGKTMAAIAAERGVSRNRIHQVCKQAERIETARSLGKQPDPFNLIPPRYRNPLLGEGICTLDAVREAFGSGEIRKIHGLGFTGRKLIADLLGVAP